MSSKHLIPDPEKLSQYCVDALEDMKKAAASINVQSDQVQFDEFLGAKMCHVPRGEGKGWLSFSFL